MSGEGVIAIIENTLNEAMPWMFWKGEVLIFLLCFFAFLGLLAAVSVKKPSNPRTGFLRIPTTLGDRVFISVVILVVTMLVICGVGLPWYVTLIIGAPIVVLILLKG